MEYLKPDFDPKSLKVAQLRRLLVENKVEFPANSKKSALIVLYNRNVKPRIPKLREKFCNVIPSDKGIINVISKDKKVKKEMKLATCCSDDDFIIIDKSSASSSFTEVHTVEEKVNGIKKEENSNKKKHKISESVGKLKLTQTRKRKASILDSEGSKSTETTNIDNSVASSTEKLIKRLKVESTEMSSNPPLEIKQVVDQVIVYTVPRERDTLIEKKCNDQDFNLKKRNIPLNMEILTKMNEPVKDLEQPKPKVEEQKISVVEELDIEASENSQMKTSTQLKVNFELSNNIKETKLETNFTQYLRPILKVVFDLSTFSSIIFLICFALLYRQQRIFTGYCGNEVEINNKLFFKCVRNYPMLDKVVGVFSSMMPKCISCPEHAICFPFMQMSCIPGYSPTKNKLSLFGLVPLSAKCVRDTKKEDSINNIIQKALEYIRRKNALVECGKCDDNIRSGVKEKELYDIFFKNRTPWINEHEFNDMWNEALTSLKWEPEIIWTKNAFGTYYGKLGNALRSTSKKYVSLSCEFQNIFDSSYLKVGYLILVLCLCIFSITNMKRKFQLLLDEKSNIDEAVQIILSHLHEIKNSDKETSFLTTGQLREKIFANSAKNMKYQNQLLKNVVSKLEQEKSIETTQMEVNGEIMRCWEWVDLYAEED